jgi:hypothetical protein
MMAKVIEAEDAITNLWPEPYAGRWGARTKDVLENKLHELVCAGQLQPTASQLDAEMQLTELTEPPAPGSERLRSPSTAVPTVRAPVDRRLTPRGRGAVQARRLRRNGYPAPRLSTKDRRDRRHTATATLDDEAGGVVWRSPSRLGRPSRPQVPQIADFVATKIVPFASCCRLGGTLDCRARHLSGAPPPEVVRAAAP